MKFKFRKWHFHFSLIVPEEAQVDETLYIEDLLEYLWSNEMRVVSGYPTQLLPAINRLIIGLICTDNRFENYSRYSCPI